MQPTNLIHLINFLLRRVPPPSPVMNFITNVVLKVHCKLCIPASYADEALMDLRASFTDKPLNSALVDLREYTVGAINYRLTQVDEVIGRIWFCARKFMVRTKANLNFLNQ
jgi:hypothetical protein